MVTRGGDQPRRHLAGRPPSDDRTARIWDAASGAERATLTGHTGWVWAVAISPDGTWLVDRRRRRDARIWDAASGAERATLTGHTGWVRAVAISPDGTWLATAGDDGTARIWDVATGTERATLTGHTGQPCPRSISPDGTWLATASDDGTAKTWAAATGAERATLAERPTLVGGGGGLDRTAWWWRPRTHCCRAEDDRRRAGHPRPPPNGFRSAQPLARRPPARPLSVDDLARRRDEARLVPTIPTSQAMAASIGSGEMRIEEVVRIGPAHGQKLAEAGVTTTEALLERGATSAGRSALAEATGISGTLILEWVHHVDLMRLDGVGPEYPDLLEAAGVESPAELAQCNAANLETTFQEVMAARPGIVRRVPTETEVAGWIAQAKTLPKVVTHGGEGPAATEQPVMKAPATDGASAPVTPATDEVDCSVFAPPACRPGDTAFVQVFAHLPNEAEVAASLATEFDQDAVRRAIRSLMAPVARGDTLVFDLSFRDLAVPDPIQRLVWLGRPDSVQFEVPVPADMRLGTVVGTVAFSLRSIPVGHVKFKLEIANAAQEDARPVGDDARRYSRAFVSYASSDRDQVVRRVQMLAPLGIRYFQDVLGLEPGDDYKKVIYQQIDDCDLFLLFWSRAAKRSDWVRQEARYALQRKAGDDFAPPEIRPIILEGPPVEPPWDELAHIHFNDRLVWFIGSDTTPAEVRK